MEIFLLIPRGRDRDKEEEQEGKKNTRGNEGRFHSPWTKFISVIGLVSLLEATRDSARVCGSGFYIGPRRSVEKRPRHGEPPGREQPDRYNLLWAMEQILTRRWPVRRRLGRGRESVFSNATATAKWKNGRERERLRVLRASTRVTRFRSSTILSFAGLQGTSIKITIGIYI